MANFALDRDFTTQARKLLFRDLYPRLAWGGHVVDMQGSNCADFIQRHVHIDVAIATHDHAMLGIEEKIVRGKFERFVIETHSDTRNSPPDGWIYTSAADRLLYCFTLQSGLECHYLNMGQLRQWWQGKDGQYPVHTSRTYGWVTQYSLVPIRDVPKHEIYELRW